MKGYPTSFMTLGEHLRKRRLDLGLLQKEVAKKMGVCQQAIYQWESGKVKPYSCRKPAIVEFLGYDPADGSEYQDRWYFR